MPTLTLRLDHPARQRCPHCASHLPKAGFVVTDDAQVSRFLCRPHLAEFSRICRLEPATTPPDVDYFAFYPYGYLY